MSCGKCLKVGDEAPVFSLRDQNKKKFRLNDFKGKKVLLSFHPLAWTDVCAKQMQSLEDNYQRFLDLNTVPVGLSVDTVPSKEAWAEELQIEKLSMLADFWPHGKVAKLYDIFRDQNGHSERCNIIIDEEGKVEFIKIYDIPQLPDVEEIITELGS